MKTYIPLFVLCCLFACQSGKTDETNVPSIVKEAFAKQFPGAEKLKWSTESETEYEAEFEIAGTEKSANFDQNGKWLITETEVKTLELPQAVQAAISKEFEGYEIDEAELAESATEGNFYEVELEKGESGMEVKISAEGVVLKKEEKEEGEDEEEKD